MELIPLLQSFSQEIKRRTNILNEDLVRYTFYSCLLRKDKNLNSYVVELPYKEMGRGASFHRLRVPTANASILKSADGTIRQKLDLFYDDYKNNIYCIEFKFHRKANSSFDLTSAAGSVFNDLLRLQTISPLYGDTRVRRLFVYVTDNEMHNYFTNKNNAYRKSLHNFYTLPIGQSRCVYFTNAPKSFINNASSSFNYPFLSFCIRVCKLFDSGIDTESNSPINHLNIKVFEVIGCNSVSD